MSKRLLICAAIVIAVGCKEDVPRKSNTLVAMGNANVDLGVIVGHSTEHTFVIFNDSSGMMVLGEPHRTCKCTMAEVAHGVLQPGQKTEVNVTLTGMVGGGTSAAEIFIPWQSETAVGEPQALRLSIRAEFKSPVKCTPSIVSFSPDDTEQIISIETTNALTPERVWVSDATWSATLNQQGPGHWALIVKKRDVGRQRKSRIRPMLNRGASAVVYFTDSTHTEVVRIRKSYKDGKQ